MADRSTTKKKTHRTTVATPVSSKGAIKKEKTPKERKVRDENSYQKNEISNTVADYDLFKEEMKKMTYPLLPAKFYKRHVMFRPPVAGGYGVVVFLQNLINPNLLFAVKIVRDCPKHERELYWIWSFRNEECFVKLQSLFTDSIETGPPAEWRTVDSTDSVWKWPRQLYIVTEYYPYTLENFTLSTKSIFEHDAAKAKALLSLQKMPKPVKSSSTRKSKLATSKATKNSYRSTSSEDLDISFEDSDNDDDERTRPNARNSYENYTPYKTEEESESDGELQTKLSSDSDDDSSRNHSSRKHSESKSSRVVSSKQSTKNLTSSDKRHQVSGLSSRLIATPVVNPVINEQAIARKRLFNEIYLRKSWLMPDAMLFSMNDDQLVQFMFELFYGVFIGRFKFSYFEHLDMNARNITVKLTNTVRQYPVKDKFVCIDSVFQPVIIDFGISEGPWTPEKRRITAQWIREKNERYKAEGKKRFRKRQIDYHSLCNVLHTVLDAYDKQNKKMKRSALLHKELLKFKKEMPSVVDGNDTTSLELLLSSPMFDTSSRIQTSPSLRPVKPLPLVERNEPDTQKLVQQQLTQQHYDKQLIFSNTPQEAIAQVRTNESFLSSLQVPVVPGRSPKTEELFEKAEIQLLNIDELSMQQIGVAVKQDKKNVKQLGSSIVIADEFA